MPILPSSARLTFVAAATLVTGSAHAFCQASPWDYVPNLPYTARVVIADVETQADGTPVPSETNVFEARDSQGTTRRESFLSDHPDHPASVTLYVPLHRLVIDLFPEQKTARVMTFPGTGPIPTHGLSLNAVKTTTESLPGITIHGMYAEGSRTRQVSPSGDGRPNVVITSEKWVSPELKIVIIDKYTSTGSSGDQMTWEIRKLDRGEPNSALFEIPPDYKIVEATTGPR